MWTPAQWSVAFPIVAGVMLSLAVVWMQATAADASWLVALAAGVIAGAFAAIGWVLRPLLTAIGVLCAAAALVVIMAAEASDNVGLVTAAIALAVSAVWIITFQGFYIDSIARPRRHDVVERFGDAGAPRRALIIHHPSPGGFLTGHLRTLAQTLVQQGWQVELAVADPTGTTPHGKHDVLVLASPVFNFRPARAFVDQIRRLALTGENVILIVSGYGLTEPAMRFLQALMKRKGAHVVSSVEIWTTRPNSERYGTDDVAAIMRSTAEVAGRAPVPASKAA